MDASSEVWTGQVLCDTMNKDFPPQFVLDVAIQLHKNRGAMDGLRTKKEWREVDACAFHDYNGIEQAAISTMDKAD
jgi:hypothetical protein